MIDGPDIDSVHIRTRGRCSKSGSFVGGDAPGLVVGEESAQPSAGGGAQRSRRLGRGLPKSAAPPNHDRWSNSHHGLAPDGGARRCLKCLVGYFAEEIFVGPVEFGAAVVHEITL